MAGVCGVVSVLLVVYRVCVLQITIPFRSVRAITKEKTALVIPNAIQISVSSEKYGFSSLVNRDVTFNIIFKCWQNNLLDQVRGQGSGGNLVLTGRYLSRGCGMFGVRACTEGV